MAARFPLAIVTIAVPARIGGPAVRLQNANAVLLDAGGQCMFDGHISTLDATTRALLVPGSKPLLSADTWRCWTLMDGRSIADLRGGGDEGGGGEGGGGATAAAVAAAAAVESTPQDWLWNLRDRVRPLLLSARDVRTGVVGEDTDDRGATLLVEFQWECADAAERLHAHLQVLVAEFNKQIGLDMRASVEVERNRRLEEQTVRLRVERSAGVAGPHVFSQRTLQGVLQTLAARRIATTHTQRPYAVRNTYLETVQQTRYQEVVVQWLLPLARYQWRDGKPVGREWVADCATIRRVAASVQHALPQLQVDGRGVAGELLFLVE
jgi:hypothetical protein